MTRVFPGEQRFQLQSFAFYRVPAGTAANVFIRRQVPLPQDFMHSNSQATQLQRQRFAKASKDWKKLSYWEKRAWDDRLEEV